MFECHIALFGNHARRSRSFQKILKLCTTNIQIVLVPCLFELKLFHLVRKIPPFLSFTATHRPVPSLASGWQCAKDQWYRRSSRPSFEVTGSWHCPLACWCSCELCWWLVWRKAYCWWKKILHHFGCPKCWFYPSIKTFSGIPSGAGLFPSTVLKVMFPLFIWVIDSDKKKGGPHLFSNIGHQLINLSTFIWPHLIWG